MSPRRLPRMLLFAAAGAAWCAAAGVLAVALGRTIAHADRPSYTPQLDVPLWHGTDLPRPGADLVHETWDEWPAPPWCPGCAHGECLRSCPPGTCGAIDDDEAARAALADDAWPFPSWSPRPPSEPDPFTPTNRRDPRDPDAWPLPLPHLWTFPDRPTEEHP